MAVLVVIVVGVVLVVPPSVLPDISPSRGEIDSPRSQRQTVDVTRMRGVR
jgi:cobaltochelatase CobN